MKTHGLNSKLITAYTALATVALGVVALDLASRANGRDLIPAFPALTLAVQSPFTAPAAAQKPAAPARTDAALPKAPTATNGGARTKVTVANYTTQRPAM